jgi:hypothetical protein
LVGVELALALGLLILEQVLALERILLVVPLKQHIGLRLGDALRTLAELVLLDLISELCGVALAVEVEQLHADGGALAVVVAEALLSAQHLLLRAALALVKIVGAA